MRGRRRWLPALLFLLGVALCAGAIAAVVTRLGHSDTSPLVSELSVGHAAPASDLEDGGRSPSRRPANDLDAPALAAPTLPPGQPGARVPILMYHYVRDTIGPSDSLGHQLSVSAAELDAQLSLLAATGYQTVSLAEVMNAVDHGAALPAHPVVITFDDGYSDFATRAAPIIAAHHMTATTYVVTGFIGKPGYMTADQVRQTQALGMTIGAHTIHHLALSALPASVARLEIGGSRAALELLTGTAVDDFAYPYGAVTPAVAALVAGAGFRDAVTTAYGAVQSASIRFTLPRIRVIGGASLADFAASVGVGGQQPAQAPPPTRSSVPAIPAAARPPARAWSPSRPRPRH